MGFLIFAAAVAVVILIFAYYCYRTAFYSPKNRKEDLFQVPDGEQYAKYGQRLVEISLIMDDAQCKKVQIQAQDGTTLSGRLYEFYPDAPVILAFHGYRSIALRDCAGAFALSQKLGFNILAPDQRAHGESGGKAITFGIRERKDCMDWIKFLCGYYGPETPIILSGISMGAATVLMASELDLPKNVACIMADCPYDTPMGIISKVAGDRGYPVNLSRPIIALGARIFAGLNINETSASDAVRSAKVPILLIHGEDDRFVPCDMSRHIASCVADNVQLHTFPDAGHGLCYIMDPRRYEKICVDFLWSSPALVPHLEKSEFAKMVHDA